MHSDYFAGAAVTQYSPAVFDAFVNQIKVGLLTRPATTRTRNMNSFSGLGAASFDSRQERDPRRRP